LRAAIRVLVAASTAGLALAVPVAAQANTKTVDMGTPLSAQKSFQKVGSDANDFFPHAVSIHVGDKVTFAPVGFHTLNIPAKGKGPFPLFMPNGKVAGANDAAGSAFWFNGQDALGFSPPMVKLAYGKSFTYTGATGVESGLPLAAKPKPITVTFKKAGTFTYFCDVHPGMTGQVKVLPKSKPVPSAKADAKTVKAQVARDLKLAKSLAKATPAANTVDVGNAGKYGVEYYGFLPGTLDVKAGTTVKFTMTSRSFEAHTATTGPGNPMTEPSSYLGKLAGSMESPQPDPAVLYPSDPFGTVGTLSPTSHGNGFWNSGAIDASSATPIPLSNSVTFTTAGTYQFYCLIHPFMHGTVKVS
jgi:plastocyanin